MNCAIRQADVSDIERLAIFKSSFGGEADKYSAEYQKEISTEGFGRDRNLFVASYKSQIVGYGRAIFYEQSKIGLLYGSDRLPDGWFLRGIFVHQDWRSKGFAKALTDYRIGWISNFSDRALCFIHSFNVASIKFHEKIGFKEIEKLLIPKPLRERGKAFFFV